MTVKNLTTSFFALLISINAFAQQDAKYNHYMFNGLALNPAYAAATETGNAMVLYRNQWGRFENSAGSKSLYATAQHPVPILKGGVGIVIANDQIWKDAFTNIQLTYAYKRPLRGGNLSIGTTLGLMQATIGSGYAPTQPGDPAVPLAEFTTMNFDANLGVYYTAQNWYAGLSVSHIALGKITQTPFSQSVRPHAFLTGGYNYTFNENITLMPSVLVKTDLATVQTDLTLLALYKNRFWAGMAYSSGDGLVPMLGMKLNDKVKFGYAYNTNLSGLQRFGGSTHEFFVGYDFLIKIPEKQRNIIRSPRFL